MRIRIRTGVARWHLLVAALAIALAPAALRAQDRMAHTGPYSLDEVIQLVQSRLPTSTVLESVSRSCVNFQVTADVENRLFRAGADVQLVDGLKNVCTSGGGGAPSAAAPSPPDSGRYSGAVSGATSLPPSAGGGAPAGGAQFTPNGAAAPPAGTPSAGTPPVSAPVAVQSRTWRDFDVRASCRRGSAVTCTVRIVNGSRDANDIAVSNMTAIDDNLQPHRGGAVTYDPPLKEGRHVTLEHRGGVNATSSFSDIAPGVGKVTLTFDITEYLVLNHPHRRFTFENVPLR